MADDRGELRQIAWSELCPWLILFRTFSLSISLPILSLATVGALLTPIGWLIGGMFVGSEQRAADRDLDRAMERYERWPSVGGFVVDDAPTPLQHVVAELLAEGRRTQFDEDALRKAAERDVYQVNADYSRVEEIVTTAPRALERTYNHFVNPWRRMFALRSSVNELAWLVFGSLWTLLVWSFFGAAITRIAAVQLGREERISLREALTFARRKLASFFLAPIFPLFGLAAIVLLTALLVGLPMASNLGAIWAGIVWIFVLLGALVSTVVVLGVLVGWPLMWPAISSEGSDHFDAFSRAFSYPFQRPLHYLFYAFVAAVVGALGLLFVLLFSELVIHLGYWSASWGANLFDGSGDDGIGMSRIEYIRALVEHPDDPLLPAPGRSLAIGARLMGLSVGLVRVIAAAYLYSFFWCAATAIYLLLRRDVDNADFDEVFVDDEEDRYGLPELTRDPAGVPGVTEPAAANDAAESAPAGGDESAAPEQDDASGDNEHS